MKIIIPARRNSKGLPFKNRKLLNYTISSIPENMKSSVYVSTDDEVIIEHLKDSGINIHHRSNHSARDQASTKELICEFVDNLKADPEEIIVMMYLTYPERTFDEVLQALEFFKDHNAKSLLCKKEVKSHPFLCLYEVGNHNGEQIVEHDLYRRQDYPKCFEISHYISIFKAKEVERLNKNLYNKDTIFYKIDDKIDVDLEQDLQRYEKND